MHFVKIFISLFLVHSHWYDLYLKRDNSKDSIYDYAFRIKNRLQGSYIGRGTLFEDEPFFPHGVQSIFISGGCRIGSNCTIYQQTTIGGNYIDGSEKYGSPQIGDNCIIGAGAKIIGNVAVGNNCRIGANAVVVKDVPDNATVVSQPMRIIIRN